MYKCVNVYDHLVRAGCVAVVVCSRLDSAVHFDIDIFAFFVYVIGSRQTVLCRCLFCYLCLSDVMMRQIVALLCCIHPPFYLNQFPARFLPCRSCAKVFFCILFLPARNNASYMEVWFTADPSVTYFIHFSWCWLSQHM